MFTSRQQEDKQPVFYKVIKAGKRTYYIDIYTTRQGDYYITIKEQFKSGGAHDGQPLKRQKIMIYKEDLGKFSKAFSEVEAHLREELLPSYDFDRFS